MIQLPCIKLAHQFNNLYQQILTVAGVDNDEDAAGADSAVCQDGADVTHVHLIHHDAILGTQGHEGLVGRDVHREAVTGRTRHDVTAVTGIRG